MATVTKAANAHTVQTTGWTNPSNAYATTGDNVYATAVPAKNATVSGFFGFPAFTTSDIPDGSLIESVDITVEWGMTAAVTGGTLGCYGYDVTGGEQFGPEVIKTTTTEAQTTIHCDGVLLSELRTANRVQARARCSKGATTNAMTGNLDFVSLTVTYSAAPVSGAIPVKASKLTGTTTSASGPISSTAGNALFVGAVGYTANLSGVLSVSDSVGNTYTVDSQGDSSASTLRSRVGIASAPNVAGGTATLTVSCTNGQGVWAQVLEMSGMATSSMLDSSAPAIAIGSSATGTSNSETNTQADAVFLGMVGSEAGSSTSAVNPAAGWFDVVGDTWMGQRNGAVESVSGFAFQIVASSAARTASWALTSANWGVLVAAYKVAASGTSYTRTLTASIAFGATLTRTFGGTRAQSIATSHSATLSRGGVFTRTLSVSIASSAALSATKSRLVALSSSIAHSASLARVATLTRTLIASVAHAASVARAGAFTRALSSAIASSATLTATKTRLVDLSSSIAHTASLARIATLTRTLSASVAHAATLVRTPSSYLRALSSSIAHAAAVSASVTGGAQNLTRTVSSSIAHAATLQRTASLTRTLSAQMAHSASVGFSGLASATGSILGRAFTLIGVG